MPSVSEIDRAAQDNIVRGVLYPEVPDMTTIQNHLPTAELQALDAAHHMHPFTHGDALAKKGARVITSAKGVFLKDSDGVEILDGMSGLWCVNLGYGRSELA